MVRWTIGLVLHTNLEQQQNSRCLTNNIMILCLFLPCYWTFKSHLNWGGLFRLLEPLWRFADWLKTDGMYENCRWLLRISAEVPVTTVNLSITTSGPAGLLYYDIKPTDQACVDIHVVRRGLQ